MPSTCSPHRPSSGTGRVSDRSTDRPVEREDRRGARCGRDGVQGQAPREGRPGGQGEEGQRGSGVAWAAGRVVRPAPRGVPRGSAQSRTARDRRTRRRPPSRRTRGETRMTRAARGNATGRHCSSGRRESGRAHRPRDRRTSTSRGGTTSHRRKSGGRRESDRRTGPTGRRTGLDRRAGRVADPGLRPGRSSPGWMARPYAGVAQRQVARHGVPEVRVRSRPTPPSSMTCRSDRESPARVARRRGPTPPRTRIPRIRVVAGRVAWAPGSAARRAGDWTGKGAAGRRRSRAGRAPTNRRDPARRAMDRPRLAGGCGLSGHLRAPGCRQSVGRSARHPPSQEEAQRDDRL